MYRKRNRNFSNFKRIIIGVFTLIVITIVLNLYSIVKFSTAQNLVKDIVSQIDSEVISTQKEISSKNFTTDDTSLRLHQLTLAKNILENELDSYDSSMISDLSRSSKISKEAIKFGYQYIGYPYVFGATGPDAFDCSSFIQHIFSEVNVTIPRITYDQVKLGKKVRYNKLKPGDLVFTEGTTKKPEHVGIYVGGGQMLHASKPEVGVTIGPIINFKTARRIL